MSMASPHARRQVGGLAQPQGQGRWQLARGRRVVRDGDGAVRRREREGRRKPQATSDSSDSSSGRPTGENNDGGGRGLPRREVCTEYRRSLRKRRKRPRLPAKGA
ncbi:hypothetical protein TEQG_08619 [Trichophyton equinum CBS 127.97]|uniref:Uncharacterized protein n=1 Tax=Trichophyton equinum (strain ATCC MYA-4606 / CBS 127.97) TaxID=559882 RepID=F2PML9_TRIEC|nr:hypothetical protein TEQG_08619 [Trichophyton equinum CBS 127.97]